MAEARTDVLFAAYQDVATATRDFDRLMQIVKDKQVEIEGAILVTHDANGAVTVVQHLDHLGRKGLGWGAGVGLVVGLFAPPLLGSVAVGAAAGGLIGKFTDRKVKAGMETLGEKLPPGSAGVISVFDDEYRLAVEQALPGSPAKSVAQADKGGLAALKAELATAMGKFNPDRTKLRIPDRTFGGTMGHTVDQSAAGADQRRTPAAQGPGAGEPRVASRQRDPEVRGGVLRGGARPPTDEMIAFIDANRARFGVEPIGTVLPIARPPTISTAGVCRRHVRSAMPS